VQQGPTGTFVYIVGPDATVTMTPVTVALTQGDSSVIDKGLAGGERVVIEGANQLRNGGKVDTGQPPALPSTRGHRGSGGGHPSEAARPPEAPVR
ncbi:MAG: multidrug transporter subunit MdtA, partial [Kofleriaceae bacterium]